MSKPITNSSEPDPVYLALSRYKRRKYDSTIDICTNILKNNPYDQAIWYLKCKSLINKNYIDDTDLEDEGIDDILMDDNSISNAPRPGTSLSRPLNSSGEMQSVNSMINQGVRPMTNNGRPISGYLRPGTQAKKTGNVSQAFEGNRPGTMRPVSVQGRYVRLGTASLLSSGGSKFIQVESLDVKKYVKRPALAKALCDYMLYVEHNPKKALELCSEATTAANFKDWWWKARLGKCYYQLGLYRDAEKQFKSALKQQEMVLTYLELGKVYIRLDQPNTVLDVYTRAAEKFPGDTHLILGIARVYESLNDLSKSIQYYKKVLHFDAANAEAIACLASHHFYNDQPEISLRFFRRLLQMGINNSEVWNNIGLCCFYASQYDLTLSCFEKALALADDENMADIWYNIGQVSIGIGDLNLAYQAFKIAISIDPKHAESFNNIGVLEMRKNSLEQARANFQTSSLISPHSFEPYFNHALLCFKLGDCQESYDYTLKGLKSYPEHADSIDLLKQLKRHFTHL